MKVHILNYQPNKIGGGWSFTDNFAKGLGADLTSLEEADVCFIPGATMIERKDVEAAKALGKKIVLRVDNHLLPSRNRNTGMGKLKEFAQMADVVIFQSQWAKDYLGQYIGRNGVVIHNGVDLNLFRFSQQDNQSVLYARSSRIAEKGWEMARYWFSRNSQNHGNLAIIGKFSPENLEYSFDFYNNEPYNFYGQITRESFAAMLGQHKYFLYSYFMDACSNTLIEALVSGCEIVNVYGMLDTGGAPEIMAMFKGGGREYFGLERMTKQYQEAMA